MGVAENKATVEKAYGSFGEGNLDGVLATLADDVVWNAHIATGSPMAGQYKGQGEVGRFFATLAETIDIEKFEVGQIIGEHDVVVVLLNERYRVKATGKVHDGDLVHLYRFNVDGKIGQFDEFESANDAFRD